jgi:hypothetical protein
MGSAHLSTDFQGSCHLSPDPHPSLGTRIPVIKWSCRLSLRLMSHQGSLCSSSKKLSWPHLLHDPLLHPNRAQ